ncbi:hypothetical protein [Hymenobacter metallicola]|uniref:Uncharacterized protein n=1 Tax=Hymenobacter metallicola TaxID=2563114 RepID=A0A4Z0QGN4_9BACT|nr:hypothetical protein [Hymenobacter metallicola]TGE28393.1 hypothetical protein E5K02_02695 [Hymenobacter metallicola]
MHAPVVIPVGYRLVRWLAYALLQLALGLALLLHSAAGLSSAFRRIQQPKPLHVSTLRRPTRPGHA